MGIIDPFPVEFLRENVKLPWLWRSVFFVLPQGEKILYIVQIQIRATCYFIFEIYVALESVGVTALTEP